MQLLLKGFFFVVMWFIVAQAQEGLSTLQMHMIASHFDNYSQHTKRERLLKSLLEMADAGITIAGLGCIGWQAYIQNIFATSGHTIKAFTYSRLGLYSLKICLCVILAKTLIYSLLRMEEKIAIFAGYMSKKKLVSTIN
jgi:hypothetical protein